MARLFCQGAQQLMLRLPVHKTAFFIALVVWLGGMPPHAAFAQQRITLSIEGSRAYGIRALTQKRPDVAQAIALGLLQRDPNDVQALLMLCAAQTAQGQGDQAVVTGKRALTHAKNPTERFSAIRMIAAAKANSGHYTQAELWLRRALQAAPNERLRAITQRDFKLVKRKNPLKLDLIFSINPSSNINNGASNEIAWLFDRPFILSSDAQALSGIEYTAGVRARYRISQTATKATDLGVLLYSKSYSLSERSKRLAPGASASGYAFQAAEVSVSHLTLRNQGTTMLSYQATLGQNWYGGDPLNRYIRFDISQKHRVSPALSHRFAASAEYQTRIGVKNYDLTTFSASGTLNFRLKDSGKLSLSLEGRNASGGNRSGEFAGVKFAMGYAFDTPLLGTDVSIDMSAERRDFPYSPFTTNGRQDNRLTAGVSLLFSKADVYGFSPTLDFRAVKTQSSIDLYDTDSFTVGVGFRSTF